MVRMDGKTEDEKGDANSENESEMDEEKRYEKERDDKQKKRGRKRKAEKIDKPPTQEDVSQDQWSSTGNSVQRRVDR